MPLFDYADLVWGDKHNVNLMSSLQILQSKAAKIVLDRHLYSSASHALATLKWVTLEKRRFMRRCAHIYKCLNGIVEHSLILTKHEDDKSQPHYQFRNRNCYRNPMGNWFVENTIHSNEENNWAPGRNLTAIHMYLVNSLCCQHGES